MVELQAGVAAETEATDEALEEATEDISVLLEAFSSVSDDVKATEAPSWFRYNMPWWAAMYDDEKRAQLVNPSAQGDAKPQPPLDLAGYDWVRTPPLNADPILLPYQASGFGRVMLEQSSSVVLGQSEAPAFLEAEAEAELDAEAEADLDAEAEAEFEAEADAEYYVVRRTPNGPFPAVAYEMPDPKPRYALYLPGKDYAIGLDQLPPASQVLADQALAPYDTSKLSTDKKAIRSAERTAVEAKGELNYLHDKVALDSIRFQIRRAEREADKTVLAFMEAEAKHRPQFSFVEAEVDASAEVDAEAELDMELEASAELDAELEAEADAELEAEAVAEAEAKVDAEAQAGDLPGIPPVNPHMVPIPEAVRELVNKQEENPYNFPETPVYIVEKPGVAFVPDGEFFQARVGPAGSQLADFILTRHPNNHKSNTISSHVFQSAMDLAQNATDTLTQYRSTIEQPLPDAPSHGEVEADVKPTIMPPPLAPPPPVRPELAPAAPAPTA